MLTNPDFKELLNLFEKYKIRYLLRYFLRVIYARYP